MLVWVKVHGLDDYPVFHWLQVFRAFCYYYNVSPRLAFLRLAQASCGQQLVVYYQPMVVHEQYVDAGLHVSVLECVVKKYYVGVLCRFPACQHVYAVAAAFVYGDMYVGEFCLHLVRLVTDVPHPCVFVREYEAFALPLVSAAKYGHLAVAFEQPYQVFHMRGLARAADRDVADRDYRDVKAAAFQYAELEQLVAQPHTEAVQPA